MMMARKDCSLYHLSSSPAAALITFAIYVLFRVLLGDLGVAVSLADEQDSGQNGIMNAVKKAMPAGLGGSGGGPLVFGAGAMANPLRPGSKDEKAVSRLGKRRSFVGTPSWM